jgi:8-oxo-dGTP pyrophosphatase MutT (NUDIX family)
VIRWRSGEVSARRRGWNGALELDVDVAGTPVRALAFPALTGAPEPGDRVLLNTTALDKNLGTGGYALVIAVPDRLPPDPDLPGHLIKARYTPLQACVLGVDEQGSRYHDVLRDVSDLGGMPVVVADLHSALPAVLAAYYADRPPDASGHRPRVAYVMLDGGALPAWFSRTIAALTDEGWLAGTVTVGQAFGGDLEAVTLHTGLLAARHVLGAELAVVAQGPGNLGTGTRWGFSGVSCGEAVNAAAALGGRPVASLRVSDADPRDRHRPISHHSLTAYGRVALARADVVVPRLPGDFGAELAAAAVPLAARHNLVAVGVDGLGEALRDCPVRLSTMGRGLDADLAYFLAAAAAGRHAAALAGNPDGTGTANAGIAAGGGDPAAGLQIDLERSAVRVVLQDEAGRVLLFRALLSSRSARHWWELPGGGIDPGESYLQAAVREIREETGLEVSPEQVSEPRWRRSATWTGRGIRRLQHEVVVQATVPGHRPEIVASGQTAEEQEEYVGARWWEPGEIAASTERFYPGRLPELLPAFLAGAALDEPFERWN